MEIPEAMEAVLKSNSRIEPKVAILKPLSAAIAIGTGGPFGSLVGQTALITGDHVRVSFHERNGRRLAQRIEELATRQ